MSQYLLLLLSLLSGEQQLSDSTTGGLGELKYSFSKFSREDDGNVSASREELRPSFDKCSVLSMAYVELSISCRSCMCDDNCKVLVDLSLDSTQTFSNRASDTPVTIYLHKISSES